MKTRFQGWAAVAQRLHSMASDAGPTQQLLNDGQRRSLVAIAERIGANGILLADEVGMGKTRIAVSLAQAVIAEGGRVAVLVPPALGYQWADEFSACGTTCRPMLRSLHAFLEVWRASAQPPNPWASEPLVLVSHAFTNWRLSSKSETWRWALLPELYAQWRVRNNGRLPHGYNNDARLAALRQSDERAYRAACGIAASASRREVKLLDELLEETPWKSSLDPNEYTQEGDLRVWLEKAVGLGLGTFDLIVVDEAHKSRGAESGLTRLLDRVIQCGNSDPNSGRATRRICMTATPIELDPQQWKQILERIGVDAELLMSPISKYAEAVNMVRGRPSEMSVRQEFIEASKAFQAALTPFLLRRDKREAASVQNFHQGTGLPIHAYREESPVLIATHGLSVEWQEAICAAESLSLQGRQQSGSADQRLRLTIGNGHGLNRMIDSALRTTEDDTHDEDELNESDTSGPEPLLDTGNGEGAAQLRVEHWRSMLVGVLSDGPGSLYEHPGVKAAVNAIEQAHQEGEKVLVFGRFTQPMRALVQLLNARSMLMHLDAGQAWAQSTLGDTDWQAVVAAHRQLNRSGSLDREALEEALAQQYTSRRNTRERLRDGLMRRLDMGLSLAPQAARAHALFAAIGRTGTGQSALAAALTEILGGEAEQMNDEAWGRAFIDLIEASCDRDEGDENGDGHLDVNESNLLWTKLAERLDNEFSHQKGGFARLMHGETPAATRRLLQLAFNRQNSFPRVLVAQSAVGREGLNLHRACRTVLLLHPEWNPGVVEQQIGRVDRVGSRWEQLLDEAAQNGADPSSWPRVRIWPIIFQGTYDEHHWQVLRTRWDELRAQLHGVVLPEADTTCDPELAAWGREIHAAAPNFSPQPESWTMR